MISGRLKTQSICTQILYFYILLYKEKKPSIFTAAINIKHAVCIIDGDDNLVN